MFLPKSEIFEALKTTNLSVSHAGQTVFNETPAVVFRIDQNTINLDLENQIGHQAIEVAVDVFDETVSGASRALQKVEKAMRGIGYRMDSSFDVSSPEGALEHISCRFSATKFNN